MVLSFFLNESAVVGRANAQLCFAALVEILDG
jgi:hypothetical protein